MGSEMCIRDSYRELEYKESITKEKLVLKKKYIKDIQDNRRKLIEEKTSLIAGNEEEIFKKKRKIADLQDDIECMHEKISNASKVEEKFTKLKDIQSQLKEKHRAHNRLIGFFEKNEDCPTCQQHIDETFKSTMINKKKIEVNKLSKGMNDLKDELDATKAKVSTINEVNNCLLYTSPSPRDGLLSRMPSSA